MLEIKHLTKIYKTKGGADVRALDDVSVTFGETGLVFLLGKSGSGKSTLLNLAGGLDEPTSGEVIVMGKSSKEFSGSDFDSYRNTFVGFVFQEYNVLNEFTVEENVSLALELQGKTRDKEKVTAILQEVELGAYGKRRPNTLSGGQKQRIAIARALVKDPQIIMADEPTGALDSATGKQVFDTLKKLSETRLVLVVSHDREFAESYGDRIIELKDGKIISDVTKVKEQAVAYSDSVVEIGEDILTVKRGRPLDEDTFAKIKSFLEQSDGDVVISKGEQNVASFMRANRIDENGARERFDDTPPQEAKQYDKSKTKFIRSKLPARKAIKIGSSGLRLKPFRLVLTIFLSFVSFIMFGLFSTMMLYDKKAVLINSFMKNDTEYLILNKRYEMRKTIGFQGDEYTYAYTSSTLLTPAEARELGGAGGLGVYSVSFSNFKNFESRKNYYYYKPAIYNIAVLPEGNPLQNKLLAGNFPQKADEICVSSYFLECAKNLEFYSIDEEGELTHTKISSAQDLVGKKISTSEKVLNISGVFDSGTIPAKYDELKNVTSYHNLDQRLSISYSTFLRERLHTLAFVDEELAEMLVDSNRMDNIEYFDYCNNYYVYIPSRHNDSYYQFNMSRAKTYEPNPSHPQLPIFRFDGKNSALADNELIIPLNLLHCHFDATFYESFEDLEEQCPVFENFASEEEFEAAMEEFNERLDALRQTYNDFASACNLIEMVANRPEKEEAIAEAIATILDYVKEPFTVTLRTERYDGGYSSTSVVVGTFNIVGFYTSVQDQWENGIYCSQNFYDNAGVYSSQGETKYVREPDATFDSVFIPLEKNRVALSAFVNKLETTDPDTDIVYTLGNELYNEVDSANAIVQALSKVFLIAGIVLAVFSSLLLANFITLSITNKKKEIGILRAVGARGADVFKIFFSESGIIVGICVLLAIIGTIIITAVLNSVLLTNIGLDATLFVFGPLSILLMIAIAVLVALVATFLPVYFAARKKPVDSIRAL